MSEIVDQFVQRMFVGPVWPASILVVLLTGYAALAVIGLIDLDFDGPEIDLDVDPGLDIDPGMDLDAGVDIDAGMDVDAGIDGAEIPVGGAGGIDGIQSFALMSLRFVNFGRMPMVIWGSIFTVAFWSVSYALWHQYDADHYAPTLWPSVMLAIRNFVFAVFVTKLLTQPLVRVFKPEPRIHAASLIGATGEVSSFEATPDYGQVKFRGRAAPMLLNVRTTGETFSKGEEVRIAGYDAAARVYRIESIHLGESNDASETHPV